MSLCRWSSDDFKCDVYVYEDVAGGYTTHVAGLRLVPKEEMPPQVSVEDIGAWLERREVVNRIVDEADRVAIGLPHDGETFRDSDAEGLLGTLTMLKNEGYIVPAYVFDMVGELINEEKQG